MRNLKFIVSGGGTGGHIFPAIAIANELKIRYPQAEFLFVGAKGKMEMQKVPQAGYKIEGLWIAGLQRRITADNVLFPVKLLSSLLKARTIISKFKPDVVIGTGGFASGPLLQVAGIAGIPTVIQEHILELPIRFWEREQMLFVSLTKICKGFLIKIKWYSLAILYVKIC